MEACSLTKKNCKPCEGGVPALSHNEATQLLAQLKGWTLTDKHILKEFKFKNFVEAMVFVNAVADTAEKEGHHPDLFIHYNLVKIDLWTHAINGLSENDFIVAAKIDSLHH